MSLRTIGINHSQALVDVIHYNCAQVMVADIQAICVLYRSNGVFLSIFCMSQTPSDCWNTIQSKADSSQVMLSWREKMYSSSVISTPLLISSSKILQIPLRPHFLLPLSPFHRLVLFPSQSLNVIHPSCSIGSPLWQNIV